jgi:hypothetical protein
LTRALDDKPAVACINTVSKPNEADPGWIRTADAVIGDHEAGKIVGDGEVDSHRGCVRVLGRIGKGFCRDEVQRCFVRPRQALVVGVNLDP